MILTYVTGTNRYEIQSSFEEKDVIKQAGRFRWDPGLRRWWTDDPTQAARLIDAADADTRSRLEGIANHQRGSLAASKAVDADIDIPCPAGLEYMPFQKAGIAYAMQRLNALIGDEPGLGKTIQAAGLINVLPEIKRVLVICPASLKINWSRELKKWLVRTFTVEILNGHNPDGPIGETVWIVNYDVLKKHEALLSAIEWDLVICDEAHYLKNPKTQRTKQTTALVKKAKRFLPLTGTPIVNRPVELWPLLQLLDPTRWNNFFRFAKEFCGAHQKQVGHRSFWDFSGATNLERLQRILRETVMVRRLKVEVLPELPPKRRQLLPIPAPAHLKAWLDEERGIAEEWETRVEAAEQAMEFADATDNRADYEAAAARLQDVRRRQFTEISDVRHKTALAKVPEVIEQAQALLEAVPKLVIMAHHRDVILALAGGLAEFNPVTLTGEDSQAERQKAVDRFQADPSCRVFIGSIQAAGVGLTLTAADTVLFAELDWVPGNMTQAEDRCHRIGQRNSVMVYHVVLDGSIDAKMAQTLIKKQEVIDRGLDKKIDLVVTVGASPVTDFRTKDSRLSGVPELTFEQVEALQRIARRLAGLDMDHASELNDMGYNGGDSKFGHVLAGAEHWSPKMAGFAYKMLRKYRKQIDQELYEIAYPPKEETDGSDR